jgi:uncharacterized spore protein YtfJ
MFMNPFLQNPAESMMVSTMREFEKIIEEGMTARVTKDGDTTVIAYYITSFGIGVGGGSAFGEPVGGGGGGGGGTIPCALVIIDPHGTKVYDLYNEGTPEVTKAHANLALSAVNRINGRKPVSPAVEKTVVTEKPLVDA